MPDDLKFWLTLGVFFVALPLLIIWEDYTRKKRDRDRD